MSTVDTDALTERIARALYENAEYFGPEESQPAWETLDSERQYEWKQIAAAVLPSVVEEVRKAKAEALREMQEHHEREADKAQTITARGIHLAIADGARKRATEYETGDSDEHR